jgi:hypothetical protein
VEVLITLGFAACLSALLVLWVRAYRSVDRRDEDGR